MTKILRYILAFSFLILLSAPAVAQVQNIYVVDQGTIPNQIDIFPITANGNVAPSGIINSSSFNFIQGIALDSANNIWVADAGNSQIYEFAAGTTGSGPALHTISSVEGSIASPEGLSFDSSGNLWVADISIPDIYEFSAIQLTALLAGGSGAIIPARTITNDGSPSFNSPAKVIVDSSGRIFVTDPNNNLIDVFPSNASGLTVPTFTVTSSVWTGESSAPYDMVFDNANQQHIWASNSEVSNQSWEVDISACTTGTCVAPVLETLSSTEGSLLSQSIGQDASGNIWVDFLAGDFSSGSLIQFTNTGTQLNNIVGVSTTLITPTFLTFSNVATATPTPTATATATPSATPTATASVPPSCTISGLVINPSTDQPYINGNIYFNTTLLPVQIISGTVIQPLQFTARTNTSGLITPPLVLPQGLQICMIIGGPAFPGAILQVPNTPTANLGTLAASPVGVCTVNPVYNNIIVQ